MNRMSNIIEEDHYLLLRALCNTFRAHALRIESIQDFDCRFGIPKSATLSTIQKCILT